MSMATYDSKSDRRLSAALPLMAREDIERAWDEFGDVAVDDDGCIDLPWRGYPAGTDRESIWDDFDAAYPGGLLALDPSLVGAERAPEGAFPIQTVPQWNANLASGKVDAVLAVPGMDALLVARGYDERAGTFEHAESYGTASEALHALQPSRFGDTRDPDIDAKSWTRDDVSEILAQEVCPRSDGNIREIIEQASDALDEELNRAFGELMPEHADFSRLPDQPEDYLEEIEGGDGYGAIGTSELATLEEAESGSGIGTACTIGEDPNIG